MPSPAAAAASGGLPAGVPSAIAGVAMDGFNSSFMIRFFLQSLSAGSAGLLGAAHQLHVLNPDGIVVVEVNDRTQRRAAVEPVQYEGVAGIAGDSGLQPRITGLMTPTDSACSPNAVCRKPCVPLFS